MKVYISADIEGVAGVVTPQHGQPGNPEYERARRLMTEEVNAAIEGAFEGGASYVLVNDSHGPMVNLLPELLDSRAELILGRPKPMGMFAGLDASFGAVFCTGYHSGAGREGVLSHTVSGLAFLNVRVNGMECAEATLYGAYAGTLGVKVAMLSGDDQLRQQCAPLFPGAQFAVVKHALGQRAARACSPAAARAMIREAARSALDGLAGCDTFVIQEPCRLELEVSSVTLADLAAIIPGTERVGPRCVGFPPCSISDALRWVSTVSNIAAMLR